MKFYIADAFTDSLFGGNPAGVVILDGDGGFPPDETMRKTAAELRYSETAFIKVLGDREFQIKYFTPAAEVDLCGHATIASFVCLVKAGILPENCACINHTLAGDLNIEIKDGFVMMDMASPVEMGAISEPGEIQRLYDVMGYGGEVPDFGGLKPQLISTGLPDIMMPVGSCAELDALNPDMKALSDLSAEYKVTGVHAFTVNCDDATAHCRNFAPLYDIDEEAATGTSNGALTYYFKLNGLLPEAGSDGSVSCRIVQGEKMDRPSVILTDIREDADGGCLIRVGGSAVLLAEGDIKL